MLCAKRISLFAGDFHFRKVCLFGILLLFFLLPAFSAQALDWGIWTEDVAEAKTLALTHNRPILAVFGRAGCQYCEHLENQVLMQAEFLDYAQANKLVLFYCHDNNALLLRVTQKYREICGISTSIPVFYFFKVKPGADLESTASTALDPDQVSLLEISAGRYEGTKCAGVYRNATINGIPLGPEDSWDVPTFIRVIESFFPNMQFPSGEPGWNTLVPPPDGPIGYEGALDLGKVLTKDHPPANEMDWVLTSPPGNLSGVSSECWYKFTAAEGRRYVLGATGIDMAASDGIHIKVEYFRSDGERPVYPVLEEVTSEDGWDRLDRCIWLDSPDGSRANQLYFLRLSHSGGSAATNLDYKLKLHQMATKSPAVGAVSNPYWRGAHPGKWSMDVDAAKEAALQKNKPVIFCFSGLRWCRFCVGSEHTAFANPDFNAALNDAYLVVVDNRRRNDTGPSLLRENFAGGYLAANGITDTDADNKLVANLELQNALALPGASEAGWVHGPRISYPTFVYCRVQNTRSDVEMLPIGRFGYDANFTPTDENEAIATQKLEQLKMLYLNGYLERNMFAETSQQRLDAGASPFSSYIGGMVAEDWVKFSVARGKSFTAMIRARDADDEAEVDLKLYKADGKTLLKQIAGTLWDGTVLLEFIPANAAGGDFWLSVSAVNQDTPVEYQLAYRQDQLKNQVSFARTEIPVARHEKSVTLIINRQTLMPENAEPFSMQYRVVPGTASAEWFDSANVWQDLVWTEGEKASGEKELELNVDVPEDAEPLPEGYWDFRIEMRVFEGADHWAISQNSANGTLVKIYSKAVFALDEDLRALQLYVGIPFKLLIPICQGGDYDAVAVTNLPKGVVMVVPDNADPYLAGTPEDTFESSEITLRLLNDGQETDRLTMNLSVKDLDAALVALLDRGAFAGFLHSGIQGVANVGSLDLRKGADGAFTATVISKDSPEPVVFVSPAGWSYDPRIEGLLLEFPEKDGNALTLRLSADGVGTGFFRSAEGEYSLSFYPATATPAEYDGYYTVALRFPDSPYDDAENYARGWLLLDIDADGKAIYSGEMEDGTTFFGETWIYDQENDAWGAVAFFAHLKSDQARSYSGYLGGLLGVAPKSIRITSNDACIADCGGMSVWVKGDGAGIDLLPRGTVYDPARTLKAQSGDADGIFYIETRFPDGNAVIAPNRVKLQEVGNVLNNASPPNAFGMKYSNLEKGVDGVFSGTVDLLDGETLVKDVPVRGVLTPVTEDCCSIGSDLYIGYGYYRRGGQVFSIRLRSDEPVAPPVPMPELLELGGQTKEPFNYLFANDTLATISKPAKWLLYRKEGAAAWANAGAGVNIPLESAFTWQFVAVDENMLESGILEIPLRQAEEVLTFNLTGEDGAVKLQRGWNLIAVPWNVIPAADALLPAGLFCYDPQRKVGMSALEWTTGSAYWLFVTEEFEGFSLLGETDDSAVVPELARGVWHFMAWDDRLLDHVWHWNGEKFFYGAPAMPTDGVWRYIE